MSIAIPSTDQTWKPKYSRWRHGGWYVDNCVYPSGAVGCVSNNYPDKKWRIVCGPQEITFSSRDDAAKAEYIAIQMPEWKSRHLPRPNPMPTTSAKWREGDLAWLCHPNAGATHMVRVVANWNRCSRVSVESVATASDSSRLQITVKRRWLRSVPAGLANALSMLPLS